MLIGGLEGPITIRSASRSASATPRAGLASRAPSISTRDTAGWWRSRTKYSCRSSLPLAVVTLLRTTWSDIGITRAWRPRRRTSSAVTAARPRPERSSAVRRTCVARSLSPRPNQASSPYRLSISSIAKVSPSTPQWCLLVEDPGEPVEDGVGVGADRKTPELEVVGGVGDHGQRIGRQDLVEAFGQHRPAGATGEDDLHLPALTGTCPPPPAGSAGDRCPAPPRPDSRG